MVFHLYLPRIESQTAPNSTGMSSSLMVVNTRCSASYSFLLIFFVLFVEDKVNTYSAPMVKKLYAAKKSLTRGKDCEKEQNLATISHYSHTFWLMVLCKPGDKSPPKKTTSGCSLSISLNNFSNFSVFPCRSETKKNKLII